MIVPGKLFIKIFFGFWLVTLAVLGSWLIAAEYFESMSDIEPVTNPYGAPPRFIIPLLYSLQNRSHEDLPALIESTRERNNADIYLIANNGKELFDRELPDDVVALASQLKGRRRRAMASGEDYDLVAHEIFRGSQSPIVAVILYHPPKPGLLNSLRQNISLRVAIAVLVSGLMCFLLSRALTNRFKHLQQASRRLAQGELATRIEVASSGGDEADELARDFNAMAEKIERQVEAQQRLLSDVSHELRSPLARLRIALVLAEPEGQQRAQYLKRIDDETERLDELIGQLLSSQSMPKALEDHIDMVSLLASLCTDADFEGKVTGKRVTFESSLDEAVVASHGDLLHKTFENILRNALKYTRTDSTVRAALNSVGGMFEVRIEDSGPGVPDEELSKLFDEFYRVDTARPRETGGYGLGLSIARRSIELHHGKIWAQNSGHGLIVVALLHPAEDD